MVKESIECFKLHFNSAKSEKPEFKNRALVDKARVTYGIAQANAGIGKNSFFEVSPNFLKYFLLLLNKYIR